ncbi:hypothetical protein V6N13_041479 [Hibiscus sabdariffa]
MGILEERAAGEGVGLDEDNAGKGVGDPWEEKKTEGLVKMRRMASSITARGVAVTVDIGHKLGRSIAHKFAHERYTVAILAQHLGRLSRFADEIAREEKA